ncbi:MAG: hypothetical protein Q7R52_03440, partial [archaeon]|nr:hypothetical protein [archaeon]
MNAKEKQIGKVFLIGILALFLIPFVSSVYSSANVAHTNPGLNSVQYMKDKQGINLFPILDEQKCGAGNDFILQISPTGCTPSVVRSDLLEEQNVPVFCPIYATKINPLIEVDSIKHIEIDPKTLPEGVAGIGFHPAQAALSSSQIPLTSSIFGNIGYAVVVLKKQKNESSMQDYVQGTITARIVTDVENAIGAGNVQYYVSEMDDNEWSSNYQQYSFWKGKGYLRLDSIDTNGAVVSVYRDENTVLSTRSLKEGETSTDIFMPGYYCPARFNIKLDKLQVPNSYAKINVNGDVFDVSEGEDFFENKCQLRTLEKVGVVEKITVQCQGDESSEKFDLISSPKIKLNINGKEGEYEVGQHLYENKEDTNEWIYLGAAFLENANDPNSLRIYLLKSSVHEEKLTDAELKSIFGIAKNKDVTVDNQGLVQIPGNILNAYLAQGTNLLKGIIEGKKIYSVKSSEGRMLFGNLVTITGFGEPLDKEINEDFKVYFEKAETNYRKLINEFPNEKITEVSGETYAENGFIELIELSSRTEQKAKMIELCREFKEKYPNSVDKVKETCDNSLKNSNSGISNRDILINGKLRTISFEGVYEPTYDQLGALIEIENARGFNDIRGMTKNQDMALSAEEYFKIKEIGENYVVVSVKVEEETVAGVVVKLNYNPDSIRIDLNDYKVVGENAYKISLRQINLKKSARIKILSRIENAETKANFTFKIGIEKRAIQLSPEKTKSRIENLNKQINKWENVSEKLDKTVSTMTKACFATDALLTLKNTFANNGLNSIARQKVMRDTNGWFDLCTKKVSEGKEGYNSVDDCLYKNANKIDADVNKMAEIMGKQNEQIKTIQEGAMKDVMIGKMVDDNKYVSEYLPKVRDSLPPTLEGVDINNLKNNILTIDGFGNGTFDKEDLRDMQLYSQIANSDASPELKAIANQDLQKTISGVSKNSESFIKIKSYQSAVSGKITGDIRVRTYTDQNKKLETYDGATTSSQFGDIPSGSAIQPISVDGIIYHVTLFSIGVNEYNIENVYDENGQAISENLGNEIKKKYSYFQMFDQTSYKNKITEAKIRYFETAPYKGYPAIVPFDVEKGWYAAVKQTLTGNLRAYDESGKVVSYYICNVGKNNKIEFDSGIGDDICEGINAQTKQVYNQFPGLESSETIKLVNDAVRAIEDAQRGYRSGVTSVNVRGKMISVGNPMTSVPEIQCQDFMSPKDCHILFNVCDPVMCPSSRCNLGGAYTVDNVAQTGIIGSVALCLPNYKEKILIPVCLTGVNNGVKGLLSMTKSYRDCLQESLDTGKTVGICDEIQSIYLCELAWREAAPLANIGIPKLLSIVFGQGTRGGGEYLGIASAWTKVQDSVTYFTQYYGVNAYKAFKARSTSEIGGELCKVYLSMKSPKNILDALAIPDSPVQYTARFDEIPFTTSTNPAISQYKVFYHIYAGQNEGAYYKVYLKSPTGTSLYQQNPTLLVAQGYIGIGQPATETKDFTAASDYKELCVSINTQEKCGFKQVSTSFAVDYITEKYIASQASKTNVKTEKECISSSTYDYGITRICATDNPGLGTDAKADAVGSRWISVGYCDSENLKCWLDTQSVKNIIDIKTIENATLSAVTDNYMNSLVNEAGFLSESQYQTESNKIKEVVGVRIGQGSTDSTKLKSAIENIDTIYTKILLINEKVQLLDFEARAYNKLA